MKKYPMLAIIMFALTCTPYLTANAANDMYVGETQGEITRVWGECIRIEGEALTDAGYAIVDINISGVPAYDLITGQRVSYTEARKGMSVRAAYAVDTYPRPYPAIVLWFNACHDDAAVFTAVVSENIRRESDCCVFLTADGRYRIVFSQDTRICDPHHGEMTVDDILPGQEFFIWVDSITASCPSWVYPHKAVLVR
ncbi:MAG: hypothetical protein FWE90_03670 [Defluviitaleaceae bacterium]|nr:hypothetical protein [Defluviitaleaceae bacterium]